MCQGFGNSMTSLPRGPAPIYNSSQGSTFNGLRNQDAYVNRGTQNAPFFGPVTNPYGQPVTTGTGGPPGWRNDSAFTNRPGVENPGANLYAPKTGGVNTVNAPRFMAPSMGNTDMFIPPMGDPMSQGSRAGDMFIPPAAVAPPPYVPPGGPTPPGVPPPAPPPVTPPPVTPPATQPPGGQPSGPMWDGFSQINLTGANGSMGLDPATMQSLGFNGLRASLTQNIGGAKPSDAAKFWVTGADGAPLGSLDMLGRTNGLDLRNLGPGAKINWSGLGPQGAMLAGNGRRY